MAKTRKKKTAAAKALTAAQRRARRVAYDKRYKAKRAAERKGVASTQPVSRAEAHEKGAAAGSLKEVKRDNRDTPAGNRRGDEWYYARRAFGYGLPGKPARQLDRGMLFQLVGCMHDSRLVGEGEQGLGFCELLNRQQVRDALPCRVCGERFIDPQTLNGHGKKRHESSPVRIPPLQAQGPKESDAAFTHRRDQYNLHIGRQQDRAETQGLERENKQAPLIMENSAASRGVAPPA